MKKAILVVSFGTSYGETRKKTIDVIEDEIHKNFNDYSIFRAFTSKVIIKKLFKMHNIKIDTVEESLEKILGKGITDLIVQPTHIINGIENDIMINTINNYKSKFNSIKLGSPLLTETKDYENLIESIMVEFKNLNEDEVLLLMGHGSAHHANSAYPALDHMFKIQGYKNVYVCTMEGYPEIHHILDALKDLKPKRVHLAPLMIVAGDHAINDMSSDEEDSWKTILENHNLNVLCHLKGLGEYESIRKIYIDHIRNAKSL